MADSSVSCTTFRSGVISPYQKSAYRKGSNGISAGNDEMSSNRSVLWVMKSGCSGRAMLAAVLETLPSVQYLRNENDTESNVTKKDKKLGDKRIFTYVRIYSRPFWLLDTSFNNP